jgi:phosphate transport system permease protein
MRYQTSILQFFNDNFSRISVKNRKSAFPELMIFLCAMITILVILVFICYIFSESIPVFNREGLSFITGTTWNYTTDQYGILYFIIGTLAVTAVSMLIAFPLSILTAIFLAEFAPVRLSNLLRPMIELLVGIPSVIYGLLGAFVFASVFNSSIIPLMQDTLGFIPLFAYKGNHASSSIFLASSILAIMVLPTITVLSIEAMRSVPAEYRDASHALGSTKWETIKKVVIPVAMPGIIAGVLMGLMRAMGETMAVVMLTGNSNHLPTSIFDTTYTMTSKILNDILFYFPQDNPRSALMGIALVLFVIELFVLIISKAIGGRLKRA